MDHFIEYKSLIYLPFVKTYTITSIFPSLTARGQVSMSKVSRLLFQIMTAEVKKKEKKKYLI